MSNRPGLVQSFGGARLQRVADPISLTDAATKNFVYNTKDFSGYKSGRSYLPMGFGAPVAGIAGTATDTLFLLYGEIKRPVYISQLGARITTASANSSFQIGVYKHSADLGLPTTFLFNSDIISGATADEVNGNVPTGTTLDIGGYWFGVNKNSSNITFMCQTLQHPTFLALIGGTGKIIPPGTANGSLATGYLTSMPFGTWTNDLSNNSFTGTVAGNNPMVKFVVS